MLFHNENIYPFLPIAHSVYLKESYESVKFLLDMIPYDEYGMGSNWGFQNDGISHGSSRGFHEVSLLSLSLGL